MGERLFQTLVEATGLPQGSIEKELTSLVMKFEKNPETLTLDELREVMADYLQTVFLELLDEDIGA